MQPLCPLAVRATRPVHVGVAQSLSPLATALSVSRHPTSRRKPSSSTSIRHNSSAQDSQPQQSRPRFTPLDPNSPASYSAFSARPFLPRLTPSADPFGFSADGREGRPADIAYFTGNPSYYTAVLTLNDAIRKCGLDFNDKQQYAESSLPSWMNREEMQLALDAQLSGGKYEELIHKLSILYASRHLFPDRLTDEFFASYVKPGALFAPAVRPPKTPDKHGRAFAEGSRKTSKARCLMAKGDGELYVNGQRAGDYFVTRIGDLDDQVVRVMGLVGALDKYNVWAEVYGGGLTGQLGALQLAVARALVIMEPEHEMTLRAAGYLTPDTRQVERKKTNLAKARKRYTWVKR